MANAVLASFAAVIAPLAAALAAVSVGITVIDPEGRPALDVAVRCTRGAVALVLTDAAGKCVLPAACGEAQCMRGGFTPGKVTIRGEGATCQLGAAVVVRGTIELGGDESLSVSLRSSQTGHAAASAFVPPLEHGAARSFRIEAVPPGTYDLVASRAADSWTCATGLGPLEAGERDAIAGWREPDEVRGTVLDLEGKPFPKVLLKVEYAPEAGASGTLCETSAHALDVVSDGDGRFSALVDPPRRWSIAVDPAWRPATVRIDGAQRAPRDGDEPASPPGPGRARPEQRPTSC